MKILKVEEQRRKHANRLMAQLQLHCHLDNLIQDILAGDGGKLSEFQQFVQYAPPEMREQLLDKLHAS